MERLYTINPVPGFPSRSFERRGFIKLLSDPERWQHAPDPEWDWKATTSSDEAIGHVFVYGAIAELVDGDGNSELSAGDICYCPIGWVVTWVYLVPLPFKSTLGYSM